MKRILYFFPENPLENNAGNKTRALQLLRYFKDRGMHVDFVSLRQGMSKWDEQDVEEFEQSGWIEGLYFLQKKPAKGNRVKYLFDFKIPNQIYKKKLGKESSLNTDISINKKNAFEIILKAKTYDYIIISYLYWTDLINTPLVSASKTIVDTHDFLTLHHTKDKDFRLGATFEDEITKLNAFDEAWTISSDEQFVFGQFCTTKVRLIPPYFDPPSLTDLKSDKPYDLIYVASDNPHNIRSAQWFFEQVFPLLPSDLSVCVIGRITQYVTDHPDVHKIPFAENLHNYYIQSKIALCPMLSGTGVKIKVVEAMSYGLPVVCTSRGVDGLPNKINNGCLVSDGPGGFAKNILSLLEAPELYAMQSQWGKELFSNFFTTRSVYAELDKAFGIAQAIQV
jgi:glycosyltransferase involved in cell wall biosynthesis